MYRKPAGKEIYKKSGFEVKHQIKSGIVAISGSTEADYRECACQRQKSGVFCTACDKFFYGRIRVTCKIHPNVSNIRRQ